jgi:8-oxo-dGTP pyrophosphatase MutT (NUDIX family)
MKTTSKQAMQSQETPMNVSKAVIYHLVNNVPFILSDERMRLPGGKADRNEAPLQTLARELLEEGGIVVRNPYLLTTREVGPHIVKTYYIHRWHKTFFERNEDVLKFVELDKFLCSTPFFAHVTEALSHLVPHLRDTLGKPWLAVRLESALRLRGVHPLSVDLTCTQQGAQDTQ